MDNAVITAIATPAGVGAIAIIRVSGKGAIELVDKVFISAKNGKTLVAQKGNTIHFGTIVDHNDSLIDEVLVSLFRAPHSYTGEDSAEISCHGSSYIQQQILQRFIEVGARMAQPGEYTLRAFLNGKLDLSQAEAVADLIASDSEANHRLALNQLKGNLSNEIHQLREKLLNFVSLLELELDFGEEDVEFAERSLLRNLMLEIAAYAKSLTESFSLGNAIKKGIPVAIAGKPNAGKSTLLNTLLKEERAIVSEIAGTTRDSIEDLIVINGIGFRLIDTAGIRESQDTIETMGIERSFQKMEGASVIIALLDLTANAQDEVDFLNEIVNRFGLNGKTILALLNKADKASSTIVEQLIAKQIKTAIQVITISAKDGSNLNELHTALTNVVMDTTKLHGDVLVSNARHFEALNQVKIGIERALAGLSNNLPNDLLSQDIREVLHYLGTITGEITNDEVLGNIFSKFCIGK
ncbi:tRNA uridine-5-carboxymethylaminomethyl(34) synthesis GTPase MnmE [Williamwhitmania taraxaci]|uniref:tRNA modification GTPase MnmE n=1 Tax=Williamwhitmania taraxaci TaxID=1640674 RepID=A0A1G6HHW7_9BACT|nr:tRNA uridine-5-carboxymethylaminomethyl(34) synthesis GTPase MnmE [Williamwhitmania taraxaci]SDB93784.1 tRNA modification GTPase trmE [Williamwhitmania taraxaci]